MDPSHIKTSDSNTKTCYYILYSLKTSHTSILDQHQICNNDPRIDIILNVYYQERLGKYNHITWHVGVL